MCLCLVILNIYKNVFEHTWCTLKCLLYQSLFSPWNKTILKGINDFLSHSFDLFQNWLWSGTDSSMWNSAVNDRALRRRLQLMTLNMWSSLKSAISRCEQEICMVAEWYLTDVDLILYSWPVFYETVSIVMMRSCHDHDKTSLWTSEAGSCLFWKIKARCTDISQYSYTIQCYIYSMYDIHVSSQ